MLAAAAFLAASVTPADCGRCHTDHLKEWSASAHARSTGSPLYRALELLSRADRARAGEGDDRPCADCHGDSPDGIGCVECHAVARIAERPGAHGLATMERGPDGTYFGPIDKPADARVHRSTASAIHRDERICAPCHDHDVVATDRATLPRAALRALRARSQAACCTTLRDWRRSEMADFMTCQSCHMRAVPERRAARDGPTRTTHRHRFAGSDDADQLRSGWDVEVRSAGRTARGIDLTVAVTNRAGHALPNGEPFFARVVLRVEILDRGGAALAGEERRYGFEMLDADGSPTVLPGRAALRGTSSALASGETREERVRLPAHLDAVAIEVTLWHVPFDPPSEARRWMDELRAWMAKEKPIWAKEIDSLGAVLESRARPRLFARLLRSL